MQDIEYFIVIGVLITLVFGGFIVSFLLVNQKRHYRYLKEKQMIESSFKEALLQSQLEIREETLQHIGRELHDNLGQIASLIKINLNTIRLEDTAKASEKINDTRELVRQLIVDLKSLSVSMNSDRVGQIGIQKALEDEIEKLKKTEQFQVEFVSEGSVSGLPAPTSIILYRMTQEVINNIIKHSSASRVKVAFLSTENLIKLVISDNGVGFDQTYPGNGTGMLNLKSRAALINATLDIQSTRGGGTTVSIDLPHT